MIQSKARRVEIYHLKKDKRTAAVTERHVGVCIRQSLYSRFRKYKTSFPRNRRKFSKFPGERREASPQSKCMWLVEVSGSRFVREFNEIPAYLRHLTQRRRTYDQSVWINASDCIPIAPACIIRKPRCTFVRCWPTFVHLSIWQLLANSCLSRTTWMLCSSVSSANSIKFDFGRRACPKSSAIYSQHEGVISFLPNILSLDHGMSYETLG